jgi:hypothetical protein
VIVDDVRQSERNGLVDRAARIEWSDGDFELRVSMPPELAARDVEDASPFLCATLLLAMRRGETLELRGPVSPRLLETAPRIVDLYAQWDPRLYRTRVRATPGRLPGTRAAGIGCFFSRGVIETNLRELTDPVVRDWSDMAGAGLAFLATAMAGGFGHMVIGSSAGQATVIPTGTSPMIDPAFSTEAVAIHHDVPAIRPQKVAWLARERRDLLPYLKVCFYEDRADNCGRCSKCLLTMLSLEACGVLGLATGFPPDVDPAAMAEISVRSLQAREEFSAVERTLREQGQNELAGTIPPALERGTRTSPDIAMRTDSPAFLMRFERQAALSRLAAGDTASATSELRQATPRVSVLMPCGEASEAALRESMASVLAQTVPQLELIVLGEGRDTAVADVIAELGDSRIRMIHGGRTAGVGAALRAAEAPLVARLDAMDAWEPEYLAELLPHFDDPAIGLAYSNAVIVHHPAGHENFIADPLDHPVDDVRRLAQRNPVPPSAATMRTLAVRAAGGYARWLRHSEDHHLYLNLAAAGWRFAYVDRRLAGASCGNT